MTIDLNLGSAEVEIQSSITALGEIFHRESWEDVEPHAHRAWSAAEFAGGTPWEDIRERVRAS